MGKVARVVALFVLLISAVGVDNVGKKHTPPVEWSDNMGQTDVVLDEGAVVDEDPLDVLKTLEDSDEKLDLARDNPKAREKHPETDIKYEIMKTTYITKDGEKDKEDILGYTGNRLVVLDLVLPESLTQGEVDSFSKGFIDSIMYDSKERVYNGITLNMYTSEGSYTYLDVPDYGMLEYKADLDIEMSLTEYKPQHIEEFIVDKRILKTREERPDISKMEMRSKVVNNIDKRLVDGDAKEYEKLYREELKHFEEETGEKNIRGIIKEVDTYENGIIKEYSSYNKI